MNKEYAKKYGYRKTRACFRCNFSYYRDGDIFCRNVDDNDDNEVEKFYTCKEWAPKKFACRQMGEI
jgi:hypothetical protein